MQKIDFVNAQEPAINDTNLNLMQLNIENAINAQVSGDTLPVGCIVPFVSDTVPENWLLCDGSAVSRTDYALLFSIIGTTYGVGDGSTTFNLPNLKGRVAVGKDSTQTEFDNLGETGGEKTHTLTTSELPTNLGSFRSLFWKDDPVTGMFTMVEPKRFDRTADAGYDFGGNTINVNGGGQAHNILQPYQVTNYIIKAKQSAGIVATVVDSLDSASTTDALSANQGKTLKELLAPTILYQNSNGEGGTVTLSDDVANYERIEITFRVNTVLKTAIWERHESKPYCVLDFVDFYNSQLIFCTKVVNLSGTAITVYRQKRYTIGDSTTWTPYGSADSEINIIAVRGYKY